MSRGTIVEEIPGDELDELRIVEAIVRGPGMSKAARSPLGVAMPKAPSLERRDMSERVDAARLAVRKVPRNARDKNEWRKIVKFRLWMPVVLQVLLIVALLWYTSSGSTGSQRRQHHADPAAGDAAGVVAIAQTHALLVGYLDLSVGA